MERSKRTAWGSCGALIVQRDTPPRCYLTSDKKKKKKLSIFGVCVVWGYPAGGGGGGILRYPSPSTNRGVGRPHAGIPTSDTHNSLLRFGEISAGGGDITISFTQYWPGNRTTIRRYLRGEKKCQYLWCVPCREISRGGGGGILRYPSPSIDWGVGRPPAGIPDIRHTHNSLLRFGEISGVGGGAAGYYDILHPVLTGE